MPERRVMRHIALIVIVLLGVFLYAGFRLRHGRAQPEEALDEDRLATTAKPAADVGRQDDRVAVSSGAAPSASPSEPADDLPVTAWETGREEATTLGGEPREPAPEPRDDLPRPEEPALPETPPDVRAPTEWSLELEDAPVDPGSAPNSPSEPQTPAADAAPRITIEDDGPGEWQAADKPLPPDRNEAQPAAQPTAGGVHTVRAQETLWSIAAKHRGAMDMQLYLERLRRANPQLDGDVIHPGLKLALPSGRREGTARTPKRYTVRAGDTLSGIAEQIYGSSAAWERIYRANRHILKSPHRLPVGTRLKLPARK